MHRTPEGIVLGSWSGNGQCSLQLIVESLFPRSYLFQNFGHYVIERIARLAQIFQGLVIHFIDGYVFQLC